MIQPDGAAYRSAGPSAKKRSRGPHDHYKASFIDYARSSAKACGMQVTSRSRTRLPLRVVMANNVRRLRTARLWSQEHLAERAGLSQVYVSQIETAKTAASVNTIEKLAAALGIDPEALFARRSPAQTDQ